MSLDYKAIQLFAQRSLSLSFAEIWRNDRRIRINRILKTSKLKKKTEREREKIILSHYVAHASNKEKSSI